MEPLLPFLGHMSCHGITALFLSAAIFALFRSWKYFFICFAANFYTDIDHLYEYGIVHGLNLDLASIFTGKYFIAVDKRYLWLHSYESIGVAFLFVAIHKIKWPTAFAYSVGLLGHLMVDQFSYPLKPLAYSLIYRWVHGFGPEAFGS